MNHARLLLALLLVITFGLTATACSRQDIDQSIPDDDDSACGDDDDHGDDDSTADDDDSTGDDDSAGDDDDSAEPMANLVGISLSADLANITTRQTVTLLVEGSYDDGSSEDLTDIADFFSSDESVVKIYTPGVGQPLAAGTATISASLGALNAKATVEVSVVMAVAGAGDLVLNELMINPNGIDINEDGSATTPYEEEYVEIANAADVAVDISNVTILDALNVNPRHTFASGTILSVGHAIVVFGGGDLSALSESYTTFVTADNTDTALPLGLALNNDQDTIKLVAANGTTEISSVGYDPTVASALLGASLTLWDPEVYGTDYTSHQFAPGHNGNYSPGLLLDGSDYPGADGVFGTP